MRIFPVWLHGQPIIEAAALIESILRYVIRLAKEDSAPIPSVAPLDWHPTTMQNFLHDLPLSEPFQTIWKTRLQRQAIADV